ncbi:hypothetical protein [Streptomyces daghestanicus]|uniref:Uncharacterized protein n=1 Tax=Streptomyces daghestanicus TaxID=66885 RepID=A0ABQ3QCC0_9ACTN|nr:hypothetical protein [Streptomyces daghestanicus]GGU29419.1 hypothetical protein GCM10010259_19820 [Streptomyces daghestanicus]GHI34880.1 hypothetical protein Sdagh_66100 [Streptomyces daghestanicus]
MSATGRAEPAHLAHTFDLAERLQATGVSVFAADPGPATTGNAAQRTVGILPPALRPRREQVRQGVRTPVAVAVHAPSPPPSTWASTAAPAWSPVQPGCRTTPCSASSPPEVRAAVPAWTERLLATR